MAEGTIRVLAEKAIAALREMDARLDEVTDNPMLPTEYRQPLVVVDSMVEALIEFVSKILDATEDRPLRDWFRAQVAAIREKRAARKAAKEAE